MAPDRQTSSPLSLASDWRTGAWPWSWSESDHVADDDGLLAGSTTTSALGLDGRPNLTKQ